MIFEIFIRALTLVKLFEAHGTRSVLRELVFLHTFHAQRLVGSIKLSPTRNAFGHRHIKEHSSYEFFHFSSLLLYNIAVYHEEGDQKSRPLRIFINYIIFPQFITLP